MEFPTIAEIKSTAYNLAIDAKNQLGKAVTYAKNNPGPTVAKVVMVAAVIFAASVSLIQVGLGIFCGMVFADLVDNLKDRVSAKYNEFSTPGKVLFVAAGCFACYMAIPVMPFIVGVNLGSKVKDYFPSASVVNFARQ